MARKRVVPVLIDDGGLILPLDLVMRVSGAAANAEQHRAQCQWFRDHGIDPGDWSKVAPILRASKRAHREDPANRDLVAPDSLERARELAARQRAEGA